MGNGLTATAAGQLAREFRDGTLAGESDRQVLERFIAHRDETAFEAILYRHGAMVRFRNSTTARLRDNDGPILKYP